MKLGLMFFLMMPFASVASDDGTEIYMRQYDVQGAGWSLCAPSSAANALIRLSQTKGFQIEAPINDKRALTLFLADCMLEASGKKSLVGFTMGEAESGLKLCLHEINPKLNLTLFTFGKYKGDYLDFFEAIRQGAVAVVGLNNYQIIDQHSHSALLGAHQTGHAIMSYGVNQNDSDHSQNKRLGWIPDSYLEGVDPIDGAQLRFPMLYKELTFKGKSTASVYRYVIDVDFRPNLLSMGPARAQVIESALTIEFKDETNQK